MRGGHPVGIEWRRRLGFAASKMRPVTRLRHRTLLVAGSILLAVSLSEVGLRVATRWIFIDLVTAPDETYGWVLRPNYAGWSSDENMVWVEHNRDGFRDRERRRSRSPGSVRVAVIGDSFIHGYFLPLEQTFPTQLERRLTSCPGTAGRLVEVLSFGVFGYATTQELLTYRHRVARYSPDIVILAVYTANDIFDNHPKLSSEQSPQYVVEGDRLVLDNSFRSSLPAPPRWPLRRRAFELLVEHARTVRLVRDAISQVRDRFRGANEDQSTGTVAVLETAIYRAPEAREVAEAWQVTEALLLQFAREVAANGSELWIATLFNAAQVDPDVSKRRALEASLGVDSLFYPDRRIATLAREHHIPVISLAEPLAAYTAKSGSYVNGGNSRAVPPGDGHWNQLGTRVSAEIAAEQVCAGSVTLGGLGRRPHDD